MKWIITLLLIASCSSSSIKNIGNHQFLVNTKHDNGKRDFGSTRAQPERGFMVKTAKEFDCKKNTIIESGYYVSPLAGQGSKYLEVEKVRVAECSIVGLWCSTTNKQGKVERGTNCAFPVSSDQRNQNQEIFKITDQTTNMVICSQKRYGPEYVSPLHQLLKNKMTWKRNPSLWKKFCGNFKSSSKCVDLLPEDSELKFGVRDEVLAQIALKIVIDGTPKVRTEKDGVMWTKVKADMKPVCERLLEERK